MQEVCTVLCASMCASEEGDLWLDLAHFGLWVQILI